MLPTTLIALGVALAPAAHLRATPARGRAAVVRMAADEEEDRIGAGGRGGRTTMTTTTTTTTTTTSETGGDSDATDETESDDDG